MIFVSTAGLLSKTSFLFTSSCIWVKFRKIYLASGSVSILFHVSFKIMKKEC